MIYRKIVFVTVNFLNKHLKIKLCIVIKDEVPSSKLLKIYLKRQIDGKSVGEDFGNQAIDVSEVNI